MLLSFIYGLIGIVLLTAFCLPGAFLVPQFEIYKLIIEVVVSVIIALIFLKVR